MKIFARVALGLLLFLVLGYVVVIEIVLPKIAKSEVLKAVEEGCASCKIEIGSVSFGFFEPGRVRIRDVRLKQGYEGSTELLVRMESIYVHFDLFGSTRERISILTLELREPDVLLVDGDAASPKSKEDKPTDASTFAINSTTLKDGVFTYTRNTKGTSGTLHLAKINGEISALGTADDLKEKYVDAHLAFQIEKSGHTDLDLRVPMKGAAKHVDVSLYLRDQDLAVTTPFFNPNAGVELKGKILKGRARAQVRGDALVASTWIVYNGLELKLNPMYDRTGAEAFFMNLGVDLVMKETDLALDGKDQTEFLHAKREAGEKTVGFILRGLKEAAIKVAQKPPEQKPSGEKAKKPIQIERPGLIPAHQ